MNTYVMAFVIGNLLMTALNLLGIIVLVYRKSPIMKPPTWKQYIFIIAPIGYGVGFIIAKVAS